MPGFDRAGPMGRGPMTGRGFGPCGRGMRRGFGGGYGCGRGFGRGFDRGYGSGAVPVELTAQDERKILEAELKELEVEKQTIEKRLKEMK